MNQSSGNAVAVCLWAINASETIQDKGKCENPNILSQVALFLLDFPSPPFSFLLVSGSRRRCELNQRDCLPI